MSSDPPASSSSSAMASFPKSMKGQRVKVFLPCDCVLVAVEKRKEGFSVKLEADRRLLPDLSVGESIVLEGHGLRLNCHVDSVVEVPEREQLVHIGVRAPNNDVRPCTACERMSVSTYEGDWVGVGMRFRRSSRDTVLEADVYDGEVPKLDVVHFKDCMLLKFHSAPPSLGMGDFLVLESMDGHSQWEADVRCERDPMFFEGSNDPLYIDSILVCVNGGKGSKLLHRSKQIFVLPAPNLTSSSTNNVSGAGLQRTNEARPGEVQNMGCGRIARTMVKIALNSQDLELVAINDPLLSSMDEKTCMFRHHHPDQGWRSDFTMKDPTTLMFGEKEVTLFTSNEHDKIPWNETGAEYIVEALNYDKDTDDKKVRTIKYPHYSPNASPLQNSLAPLAKVLHDKFGMVEGMSTAVRVPLLIHIELESHEAAATIGEVLPLWKGGFRGLMLQVPTIDAPPNNIGIELAQFKEYGLISSNTSPSDRFNVLFGWCVEMAHQIPEVMYCQLNFK